VELFGGCEVLCLLPNHQWPLFEHVHEFHSGHGRLRRLNRLEPQHRAGDPPHSNRGAIRIIVTLDGRGIGLAPIDGDCLRHAMPADADIINEGVRVLATALPPRTAAQYAGNTVTMPPRGGPLQPATTAPYWGPPQ
jgi:hypothetical protein